MTMRHLSICFFLVVLQMALVGCSPSPDEPVAERTIPDQPPILPTVATLSHPVDYLVVRLGGDMVERTLIPPADADPAFWQPDDETLVALVDYDLIVANGAGYEAWIDQVNLPRSRFLDTSTEIELIETEGKTHSHGPDGEHSHGEIDPHIWLDPQTYRDQARAVHQALVALRPDARDDLDLALAGLEAELDSLIIDYETVFRSLRDAVGLAANHESYAYLARRFDLDIPVLDLDPVEAPSDRRKRAVETWAKKWDTPVLWWTVNPQPTVIAELPSVEHIFFDPLAGPNGATGAYDYVQQARQNLERFGKIASGEHSEILEAEDE